MFTRRRRSRSEDERYVRKKTKRQRYEWREQSLEDGYFHVVLGSGIDKDGRYKIIEFLGKGTFGTVVLAFDRKDRYLCAVKIIKNRSRYIEDARYEIDNMKLICREDRYDKTYCVRYLGNFESCTGHLCILMSYHGPSLLTHIAHHGLDLDQVAEICFQLLKTLDFLHNKLKLVHTDLKPENILSNRWKDTKKPFPSYHRPWEHDDCRRKKTLSNIFFVRLCDFGGCQREEGSSHGKKSIIQTRHYRAPEVVLRAGWSSSADMWSIGCIAFELATGGLLYDTHNDIEHIAMMGRHIGLDSIPFQKWERTIPMEYVHWFSREGKLLWPPEMTHSYWPSQRDYDESIARVSREKPIRQMLQAHMGQCPSLENFITSCLSWDPCDRLTAQGGLNHPFLREAVSKFAKFG